MAAMKVSKSSKKSVPQQSLEGYLIPMECADIRTITDRWGVHRFVSPPKEMKVKKKAMKVKKAMK